MARYISLLRFTDKGAAALKKSTARAKDFHLAVQKAGIKVESQLWTTGSYDGVITLNGDENKVLRCLSRLAAQGYVRTETLRAFDSKEIAAIIG